jgi:plastocyanin
MRTAAGLTVGALVLFASPLAGAAAGGGEPIALDGVEEIAISGGGTAVVAIGSPAELSISGPADVVDQLAVTVDDGELLIEPVAEAGVDLGGEELRYTITVEHLSGVRLGAGVSLELEGLAGDELDIELRDDSTASLAGLELEDLDAEVRGTARLTVIGTAGELDVDARQSGALDGTELAASTAEVEARESARVVVNVSSALDVEARDDAIVEYVGNPPDIQLDVRDSATARPATGTLLAPPASGPSVSGPPATGPATPTNPAAEPAALEVSMAGRAFSPAVLEISVGDTVTWINDDDTEHTVTADDGAFDSGQLNEGATFSFTFDTPGEFAYHCQFHSEMQATIIVR